MKNGLQDFLKDDRGAVISAELILIITICVIGVIVGLTSLQTALVEEFMDISGALRSLNQTYAFSGFKGSAKWWGRTSWTSGSRYTDYTSQNALAAADSDFLGFYSGGGFGAGAGAGAGLFIVEGGPAAARSGGFLWVAGPSGAMIWIDAGAYGNGAGALAGGWVYVAGPGYGTASGGSMVWIAAGSAGNGAGARIGDSLYVAGPNGLMGWISAGATGNGAGARVGDFVYGPLAAGGLGWTAIGTGTASRAADLITVPGPQGTAVSVAAGIYGNGSGARVGEHLYVVGPKGLAMVWVQAGSQGNGAGARIGDFLYLVGPKGELVWILVGATGNGSGVIVDGQVLGINSDGKQTWSAATKEAIGQDHPIHPRSTLVPNSSDKGVVPGASPSISVPAPNALPPAPVPSTNRLSPSGILPPLAAPAIPAPAGGISIAIPAYGWSATSPVRPVAPMIHGAMGYENHNWNHAPLLSPRVVEGMGPVFDMEFIPQPGPNNFVRPDAPKVRVAPTTKTPCPCDGI